MTQTPFDSDAKNVLRRFWAKPMLSYLQSKLGKKLLYLGLPDSNAADVKEWIESIDSVYAFQCRDYPKPSHPSQSKVKVEALENTLRGLERKKLISTYDVYDGYIEEVVLRGYDNSAEKKDFFIEDVVTVYNMDFCGQVASPLEYVDKAGNTKTAYKFNAVKKLIDIQASLPTENSKFVMFLTLHCSYSGKEFNDFQTHPQNTDVKKYIEPTLALSKGDRAAYWVKAFVHHHISLFFLGNHFAFEFLPVIYYRGDGDHPLLFFTIIGSKVENSGGSPPMLQSTKAFLYGKFLSVEEGTSNFIHNEHLTIHGAECKDWEDRSPIKLLESTKMIKKVWMPRRK